jgi:hypothetical protein
LESPHEVIRIGLDSLHMVPGQKPGTVAIEVWEDYPYGCFAVSGDDGNLDSVFPKFVKK